MALFHFKQGMHQHQAQERMLVEKQGSSNISFSKDTNNNNYRNKERNMMFEGINLGDIMKQTVMEEMRLISLEDQFNLQRMSGS